MRGFCIYSALLALFVGFGCASDPQFVQERIPLSVPDVSPHGMKERRDLVEISDCRLVFDLSDVPETVGIPLVQYNPFDPRSNGRSKTALCPVRTVLEKVLEAGTSRLFFASSAVRETTIRLVPRKIGVSKESSSVRCSMSFVAFLSGERVASLVAETTSPWTNEQTVPPCVHAAAAAIGDQFLDAVANSRHLREKIAQGRTSGGTPPSASKWRFSEIADNGFSGVVDVAFGDWDMARVQWWVRSQIEQTALVKLGVKSLDNYRVLVDGGSGQGSEQTASFGFRVFPYRGFELVFDSRTRLGSCTADLAYLGVSEENAYERAVRYVETVLDDQGTVKTAGKKGPSAQYRFNGYRSTDNGTKIEIPFELVN